MKNGIDGDYSKLYVWALGTSYIAPRSAIVHSPNFESGIVKIQRAIKYSLTATEKKAVLMMRKFNCVTSHEDDDNAPTGSLSMT